MDANQEKDPNIQYEEFSANESDAGINTIEAGEGPSKPSKNKKMIMWGIIGVIIVALAIILPLTLVDREARQERKEAKMEEKALEGMTAIQSMNPIPEGEFLYEFEKIDWVFDSNQIEEDLIPETNVGFFFNNFSRRPESGTFAQFTKPYKLGSYTGTCEDVEALPHIDPAMGTPLAFAQCSWKTEITDIALFQVEDMMHIHFRQRDAENGEPEDWTEIESRTYPIDLKTVIR